MKKVNDPGRSEVGNDQLEDLAEAMNTLPMSDTGSVETMLLQGGGEGAFRSEVHQSSVGRGRYLRNCCHNWGAGDDVYGASQEQLLDDGQPTSLESPN